MSKANVPIGSIERSASPDVPVAAAPSRERLLLFLQTYESVVALVVLLMAARILSSTFLDWINIRQQLLIFAFGIGLIAVGQTFVILTNGIDLSVGALLAVGSVISAQLVINNDSMFWVFLLPIAVTTAIGCLSGVIVAKAKVQPIVVTLAMMIAARGIAELVTGDNILRPTSDQFSNLTANAFGTTDYTIPYAVVGVLLVYLAAGFILTRTALGRSIFAVGGNEEASRLSGVAVDRVKILAYAASGLLAGLAGVLWASYESTADPQNDGLYFELATISAVVIGGTLLTGGVGTVRGTLAGLLFINILPNIFNLTGVDPSWQLVVRGGVLLVVVIFQVRMLPSTRIGGLSLRT